ncbi:vascular cell adhesion protein 1-like [Mustelus asterias]
MASGRYLYLVLTLVFQLTVGSTFNLKLLPKSELWARVGKPLVLSCQSTGCSHFPRFTWPTLIDQPFTGNINTQGSVSNLTIPSVTNEQMYNCIAECDSPKTSLTRSRMVNVYSFPDELVLGTVGVLELGKNNTLNCTVPDVYSVAVEVELLKGGTLLNKHTFQQAPVTITSELVPELGDSGEEVSCRARVFHWDNHKLIQTLENKLTLQVLNAPRMTNISVTPSHTVREGQDILLSCVTNSNPPARIVWSRESADGWSVMAEEKPTLFLPAAQIGDTGTYRCEVSNELGGESRKLEIHILGVPRDTRLSITPSTVKEESPVNVTCTSHSKPSARIILRKKTESGQMEQISETGTFTIDAAKFGDAGLYECEAINDLGAETTTAKLTVLGGPRDTRLSITPSTVKEESPVNVTCTSHSKPSARIILRKKSESGQMEQVSETGTFTIDAAKFGDAGLYECEAINDLGAETTTAELTVLGAPRDTHLIVAPPIVKEGDPVSVRCTSHSNPSAQMVLRKKSGNGLSESVSETGTLTIDAAQFSDAGLYECEAINDLGRQIRSAELIVQVLNLWAHPSMLVNEGENVTIGCTVHNSSAAKFIWKKLEKNSEAVLCSTNDYFTIIEITQSDAGFYKVEVINELGNQTGFVEIMVMETPTDDNSAGILVPVCTGTLASAGALLSALYYIYRRSNCKGSYHVPGEQIV